MSIILVAIVLMFCMNVNDSTFITTLFSLLPSMVELIVIIVKFIDDSRLQ